MNNTLFGNQKRTLLGPAREGQAFFDYLDSSALASMKRVRDTYDSWFSRWPDNDKETLRARLWDRDQCESALFELLLHEVLVRLGYAIDGPHPHLSATSRHPEFLATTKEEKVYLEAITIPGQSKEQEGIVAAKADFIDGLNKINSPDFFLWVEFRRTPKGPPPVRQARTFIENKLANLHADYLANTLSMYQDHRVLSSLRFSQNGWEVNFYPIPKPRETREKKGFRTVGMISDRLHRIDSITPIRNGIKSKATRYGHLRSPYIVAVNYLGEHADNDDVVDALFGTIAHTYSSLSGTETSRRVPDGCWHPRRNTRVSGVLFFKGLKGHHIPGASVRLYVNPWAKHPYSGLLRQFPQAVLVPETEQLELRDGCSLAHLLGLSSEWPDDDGQMMS